MEVELDKTIEELKNIPEVMAVILFGSQVSKKTKPLSDVDLAVVVKKPDRFLEAEISSLTSPTLDVVLFHRLPLYIQFEVLKYCQLLFVRDEMYLLEIKREVLREYLDTSWLYERMSRKNTIVTRLASIISRIERHKKMAKEISKQDLSDYLVFSALTMKCFQAVNSAMELGELVVSDKNLGFPSKYREVFELLQKAKIISKETLEKMKRLIFLRNLISHEYYVITELELREMVDDLDQLDELIKNTKNQNLKSNNLKKENRPPFMQEEEFVEIAIHILEEIKEYFEGRLDNIEVVVEDLPSEEEALSLSLRSPYDLLGLYRGHPYPYRGRGYTFVLPDKITLYKVPIELRAKDEGNIPRIIEKVLIHEIGHYLGLSDSQLRRLERERKRRS